MSYIVDTNVKTWGNGSAIRLSKELLAAAGFKDSENIEIIAEPELIIIKRRRPMKTLEEMFENYEGFYEPTEEDNSWLTMEKVGSER